MRKRSTLNAIVVEKHPRVARKNNKRIAKTRRQRGYHWEDTIVKRFNSSDAWKAFRLGSPSAGLPDILAVSNPDNSIFTIEAKSGTVMSLPVPADQIARCQRWIDVFDVYNTRKVILAFKFLSKKRVGLGQYESRPLREFFKEWDTRYGTCDCTCTYDGKTYIRDGKTRRQVTLKDCSMPFKVRSDLE